MASVSASLVPTRTRPTRARSLRPFAGLAATVAILALGGGSVFAQAALWEATEYRLSAARLDLDAMESPPQTVVSSRRDGDRTVAVVRIAPRSLARPEQAYGPIAPTEGVAEFLRPSAKIESEAVAFTELAATLMPDDGDLVAFVRRALSWTSNHLAYDERLAREIWEGRSSSRSALDTLSVRQGTCSEYANVLIAVMRAGGVPARFASGYFAGGETYHAWAEVYLPDTGWLPVDPQMGAYGVSNQHIKLFEGVDFEAIGVPLKEIELELEPLDGR